MSLIIIVHGQRTHLVFVVVVVGDAAMFSFDLQSFDIRVASLVLGQEERWRRHFDWWVAGKVRKRDLQQLFDWLLGGN